MPALTTNTKKPKSRLVAWLLWLFLGWIGADRLYLRRWLAGAAQAVLAAASAVLFLSRPTQVLLGQLGAAVISYSGNLIDLNSLWQTDVMLCCLAALIVWKLTDAANLNRIIRNLNRSGGAGAEQRRPLSKGGAVFLVGIALILGLGVDAMISGVSAYIAATMGLSGMIVNKLLNMLHTVVNLTALLAALRAASRAEVPISRWLLGVPPLLMLGLSGALCYLLYQYLNIEAFSFLSLGPFSAEWLRSGVWHSNMNLILLMRSASSDDARLGLMLNAAVIQGGLGIAVAAVLTAAAAAAPGKKKPATQEI